MSGTTNATMEESEFFFSFLLFLFLFFVFDFCLGCKSSSSLQLFQLGGVVWFGTKPGFYRNTVRYYGI